MCQMLDFPGNNCIEAFEGVNMSFIVVHPSLLRRQPLLAGNKSAIVVMLIMSIDIEFVSAIVIVIITTTSSSNLSSSS